MLNRLSVREESRREVICQRENSEEKVGEKKLGELSLVGSPHHAT